MDSRVRGGLRLVRRRGQHLQRDRQGAGQPQRPGRARGPPLLRRQGRLLFKTIIGHYSDN